MSFILFRRLGCKSSLGSTFQLLRLVTLAAIVLQLPLANGQTSVLSWHYDNARSGVNSSETLLTPSNVTKAGFGKLFTLRADGYVVGHPLYVPGLNVSGKGVHNVVFVATMHDSV